MDKQELIEEAWRKARYAHRSYSRDLVYQAYGYIQGLLAAKAVEWEDIREISTYICRDTLNNGSWIQKEYALWAPGKGGLKNGT